MCLARLLRGVVLVQRVSNYLYIHQRLHRRRRRRSSCNISVHTLASYDAIQYIIYTDSHNTTILLNSASGTYHTLRNADVVRGRRRSGLVRAASVAQNGQLLDALDAALAQAAQLDPVRADRLIGIDHKVVAFTCVRVRSDCDC